MAYDEDLNSRWRAALADLQGVSEKRMMGGTCFFLNGNMLGGADRGKAGRRLMVRVGKDNMATALARPGAAVMELGGRKMSGFVFVPAEQCDDDGLKDWIALALAFVTTLPVK
jgi:hypothetical protein